MRRRDRQVRTEARETALSNANTAYLAVLATYLTEVRAEMDKITIPIPGRLRGSSRHLHVVPDLPTTEDIE